MLRRNAPSGMNTNTAHAIAKLIQPMICTTPGRRIASCSACRGRGGWYHKKYHMAAEELTPDLEQKADIYWVFLGNTGQGRSGFADRCVTAPPPDPLGPDQYRTARPWATARLGRAWLSLVQRIRHRFAAHRRGTGPCRLGWRLRRQPGASHVDQATGLRN